MNYYTSGCLTALQKLGFDAESFAEVAQQDDTANFVIDKSTDPKKLEGAGKPVTWGGQASMESGDAGTRNYQMGLPRSGGV